MRKRITALLLIALLVLPLLPAQGESAVIYAYFQDARWLRAEPAAGTATVR